MLHFILPQGVQEKFLK